MRKTRKAQEDTRGQRRRDGEDKNNRGAGGQESKGRTKEDGREVEV
jgi:hypothetical protein